jgi:hypothetical protein
MTADKPVVAYAYARQASIDALNQCRNDEHNGCIKVWMRPDELHTVGLVLANDYAAAIARAEAAEGEAARWRMCNGEHPVGDGEVVKTHVNVGVNVWKGDEWLSFHECSPDEFQATLDAIAAMQECSADG